jgi:NAD(P)-dependent dehydrogenase (short-subunit alcohol dehydrogenase family)
MSKSLFVVTGSSRGLGAAMVARLLQPEVVLVGIARQTNADLAQLALARGARFEQWSHDLCDPVPAAQRLHDWLATLDGAVFDHSTLINNAGVVAEPGPLADGELAALSSALRVGLEATILLTAAFLRATQHWPADRRVLNISSGLGRRAMAGSAVYCAAKAGMDHLSRAVALEEARRPHGARIVSLAPGVIDTDMQIQLRSADPAAFPDRETFIKLQQTGQLLSSDAAAARVLAWLDRPDFGTQPTADVRDP